jgi:hypothetical protein
MNAVKELLMRIRSTYDGTGTTAAAKAVGTDLANANTKASETAKKTGKDVADAGKRGADGLNVMSLATAAMQGNFQAAASAAVPLLEKSKAVGLSMTQLSLAGAALSAVVAGLRAISEWAAAAAQRVANIQMDNFTKKVRDSAEAYEKLVESMRNMSAVKDATLAFNNSMVDSYTRQALAINELNKQRELASTADETKRREIEAKYADKAASISGMSVAQKEAQDRARSLEREEELEKGIEVSKERQKELMKEAQESSIKGQNANATVKNNLGFFGSLFGGQRGIAESYSKAAGQYGEVTADKLKSIQDEERRREELEKERLELLRMRDKASVDASSGTIERTSSDVASRTAAADRTRANQEALRPAIAELETEMVDLHASDQKAVVAYLKEANKDLRLTVTEVQQVAEYIRQVKTAFHDANTRQRNIQ